MMHRMLRYPSQWEWHALYSQRPETEGLSRRRKHAYAAKPPSAASPDHSGLRRAATDALRAPVTPEASYSAAADVKLLLKKELPELGGWMDEAESCRHNHIAVSELAGGEPVMHGTLLFQISEVKEDIIPLHFWMTRKKLVTLQNDMRLSIRLQTDPWNEKIERCESAPEAFFVVLGCILENFHSGLDGFETRLGELEHSMRRSNRTGLMNSIFERRYDLLHWSHLFIPIREIHGAAKEAFLETLLDRDAFKRIEYKLERISVLLEHYGTEIDTLIAMDDAISSFRGNDIMKTLTIFTALFTPATVIGSLWGMNFYRIPWSNEPLGFTVMSLIVLLLTSIIYWWLWQKGWTGDLLDVRRPGKVLKPGRNRAARRMPSSLPDEEQKGNAHIG